MKLNKILSMLLSVTLMLTVFSTTEILSNASNLNLKENVTIPSNYSLDTHDDDPVPGVLDEVYEYQDFEYHIVRGYGVDSHGKLQPYFSQENKSIEISLYKGNSSEIVFPSEINGIPVEYIGTMGDEDPLFRNNEFVENITKITIPSNIKTVQNLCDQPLLNLKHIVLGNDVLTIDKYTFSGCENLESVVPFSNEKYLSIQTIYEGAFSGCKKLRSFPFDKAKQLSLIDDWAFAGTNIKSDLNCENLYFIGQNAFTGSALESITIPKNVKIIYRDAFKGCENLTSVKFAGKVNNIGRSAFSKCKNLKTVNFTKGYLKKVYDYAFYGCSSLEKITISNTKNVPSIHKSAFNKAKSGIKFYVKNNTVAKKLKSTLQKTNIKKAKIYRSAPILLYKNVG